MRQIFTRLFCLGSAFVTISPVLAGPPAVAPVPADAHPLRFVANARQWENPVLFAADIPAGRLFLERGRLLVARYDAQAVDRQHHTPRAKAAGHVRIPGHAYAVNFVGANAQAAVRGEQPTGEHLNYFLGNDAARWATNVPAYSDVRYQQLYPGTDLRFYSRGDVMEYDFELAAGADAGRIRLRYEGQQSLAVVAGALQIGTSVGRVTEQQPYAYQVVDGQRVAVACRYVLGPRHTVSFGLPKGYDHTRPLVIDPVLVYSTYSGATARFNWGYTACPDTLGNLYAAGMNFTAGYPVNLGAYDAVYNGSKDIVISKYNPAAAPGSSLVYATYLGGSDDEYPHSLVVNRANELVLLGSTESANFPMPATTYRRTLAGGIDLVLAKLSANGSQLLGATYMGGTGDDGRLPTGSNLYNNFGDDFRGDVITDRQNNVYFTSGTLSTNFPTSTGAYQTARRGTQDAVVVKLNAGLTALSWSTYLGGTAEDAAYSIQLDSLNGVFVAGGTTSINFPGTAGGLRATSGGGPADGFVAHLAPTGTTLVQASYLGTSSYDQAYFVQLDRKGAVYVLGQTNGAYPVSAGTYRNAGSRQFIQKLNYQLTASVFSTVFGNGPGTVSSANPYPSNLAPTAFLVDNCGQILLSGYGAASIAGMPVTPDALRATATNSTASTAANANTDTYGYLYIMQLSANARRLVYGTYFGTGTTHVDGGTSRFDKRGIIYQAICVRAMPNGNVPPVITTTANAVARTMVGSGETTSAALKMDIARLDASFVPSASGVANTRTGCAPLTVTFTRANPSNNGTTWSFGNGQTATQPNNVSVTYTAPGRYPVRLTAFDSTSCQAAVVGLDTVTVFGLPRAAAGPDQTVCPGSSATLTLAGATPVQSAIYAWSPATGLNTTSGPTVVATPTATTQYIVTATTLAGCISRDTIVVNVRGALTVAIPTVAALCPGSSATLSTTDAGTDATYAWSPATGLSSPSGRTVTATPSATTAYTVRVTTAAGCTGTASTTVTVGTVPVIPILANATQVRVGEPVAFGATGPLVASLTAISWDFGDGQTGRGLTLSHAFAAAGTYTVRLLTTSTTGCPGSSSVIITVLARDLQYPNIITPNGDGANDDFRPYVSTEPVSLLIFNRWGRKVFEQDNYTTGWGGDANTPAGIYYYQLRTAAGQIWKGWLEVVK